MGEPLAGFIGPQRQYPEGAIVEYQSFHPSGWSLAEVVRYAQASEQWRICPNCGEKAIPRNTAGRGTLRECPRCLAWCRWPADPILYVRTFNPPRCSPFPVQESGIRMAS